MAVGPTRGKERLGSLVKEYMDRAGKNVEQVRKAARVSRDTLYNLLSGDNRPRWNNFMAILATIDVTPDELAHLVAMWEVADDEKIPVEFAAELSPSYLRFRRWEIEAQLERTLDQSIVPGIFQTPAYAEACAISAKSLAVNPKWQSIAAAERLERQSLLLGAEPLTVHALIDEAALHRLIGGREVMNEQYTKLLEYGELPNVEIRVIPFAAGAYGVFMGALTLFSFPEADSTVTAYIDAGALGITAVDGAEKVQTLCDVWDAAKKRALTAKKTADLIRRTRDSHHGDTHLEERE